MLAAKLPCTQLIVRYSPVLNSGCSPRPQAGIVLEGARELQQATPSTIASTLWGCKFSMHTVGMLQQDQLAPEICCDPLFEVPVSASHKPSTGRRGWSERVENAAFEFWSRWDAYQRLFCSNANSTSIVNTETPTCHLLLLWNDGVFLFLSSFWHL